MLKIKFIIKSRTTTALYQFKLEEIFMQTVLLILILLLILIDIKEGIRIRQLEKKTLSAFRVICEKVIANERKLKNLGKEEAK